jgi:hypothetical protein
MIPQRRWPRKLLVIATMILIMGAGLRWLMPAMNPVQDGDPAAFWLHACGVDVRTEELKPSAHRYYLPRDGWFIYYDQGMHEQLLYRVDAPAAVALFPKVVEKLRGAPPGLLHRDVESGFREWLGSGARPDDAAGFLATLRESRLARLRQSDPTLFDSVRASDDEFTERWGRAARYHWNGWFEFLFFGCLILFAAWPWLRRSGPFGWAIHLGLLPMLFCLPYWLGYAQLTFTSLGPSGGILYPWLLGGLRDLPWTSLDRAIVQDLPQPLEPLSQTPGPMLSLTIFRGPAPVGMAVLGLGVTLAVFIVGEMIRQRRHSVTEDKEPGEGDDRRIPSI